VAEERHPLQREVLSHGVDVGDEEVEGECAWVRVGEGGVAAAALVEEDECTPLREPVHVRHAVAHRQPRPAMQHDDGVRAVPDELVEQHDATGVGGLVGDSCVAWMRLFAEMLRWVGCYATAQRYDRPVGPVIGACPTRRGSGDLLEIRADFEVRQESVQSQGLELRERMGCDSNLRSAFDLNTLCRSVKRILIAAKLAAH
jgi:hypothetical protein